MGCIIGDCLIGIGFIFCILGLIGILRYRSFYKRLLIGALIDTAGILTVLSGVVVRQGFAGESLFFSLKVLLIIGVLLILNPLITHKIGRSAFLGGHRE